MNTHGQTSASFLIDISKKSLSFPTNKLMTHLLTTLTAHFLTKLPGYFNCNSSFSEVPHGRVKATFSLRHPAGCPPRPDPHLQTIPKCSHETPLSATHQQATLCACRLKPTSYFLSSCCFSSTLGFIF